MNIVIYIQFKQISGIFLQMQADMISSLITAQCGPTPQGIKNLLGTAEYPQTNKGLSLVICSSGPQIILINSIKYLDLLIISSCYNLPRSKQNMFPEMLNASEAAYRII